MQTRRRIRTHMLRATMPSDSASQIVAPGKYSQAILLATMLKDSALQDMASGEYAHALLRATSRATAHLQVWHSTNAHTQFREP